MVPSGGVRHPPRLQDWPSSFSGEFGRAFLHQLCLHPSQLMQPEAFWDRVFGDSFVVLAEGEKGSKSKHLSLQRHDLVCAHAGVLSFLISEHRSVRVLAQA